MSYRAEFRVEWVLRSPFILQGLAAAATGVDARALRDEARRDEAGRPLVPQDQVKGILRAAFFTLVDATGSKLVTDTDVHRLFGQGSRKREETPEGEEQDRPERAAVLFSDLTARDLRYDEAEPWQPLSRDAGTITRIAIDETTGAVKGGALQVVELVAPLGAAVRFVGTAVVRARPAQFAHLGAPNDPAGCFDWLANLFAKAAQLIPAVGGLKSVGFGEMVSANVTVEPNSVHSLGLPANPTSASDHQSYRVTFDRPILVDARLSAGNVYEGAAIIPGSAFKGALAQRLHLAGLNPEDHVSDVGQALSRMRISHAFPENDAGRPAGFMLPCSMIGAKPPGADDPVFGDALLVPWGKAAMFSITRGQGQQRVSPLHPIDWKEAWLKKAVKEVAYPKFDDPPKLPRGHTEIGKNYVAAEGNLFVDMARSHLIGGDPDHKRGWRLTVARNGADADVAIFRQLLAALEEGLDGIGSTGARPSFERADDDGRPGKRPGRLTPVGGYHNRWAVTLATPALMLDPVALRRDLNGDEDEMDIVFRHYAAYWQNATNASLVNFFATQRLAGHYQAVRRRLYGRGRYYPFLLTEPGSVFLLEGDLEPSLRALLVTGLPVPHLEEAAPLTWRTCPFVPENGFGEILVNAIDHAKFGQGVCHA